jgi:hypothetical protein
MTLLRLASYTMRFKKQEHCNQRSAICADYHGGWGPVRAARAPAPLPLFDGKKETRRQQQFSPWRQSRQFLAVQNSC